MRETVARLHCLGILHIPCPLSTFDNVCHVGALFAQCIQALVLLVQSIKAHLHVLARAHMSVLMEVALLLGGENPAANARAGLGKVDPAVNVGGPEI